MRYLAFILCFSVLFPKISFSAEDTIESLRLNAEKFDSQFSQAIKAAEFPYVYTEPRAEYDENNYFNKYLLKAVLELYSKYGLKGYDIKAALTHDIPFLDQGNIKALKPPYTMCVAAQLEIILTAYDIYAKETGDYSVYAYLPKTSYEKLGPQDLRGHIWVNHDFNSYGTADALRNFGMGEIRTFDSLKPGAFVNINRTNGTGHAVLFIGYIDKQGKLQDNLDANTIGFRYFSSQGTKESGGLDYRNAIFSQYGCPEMDFKRDCNVIYSQDQKYLNTGMMFHPKFWKMPKPTLSPLLKDTVLDEKYFNGEVTDR
ncbi:MAG: hypothetical protein AB1637_04295 [Elusimicrobiota bacterium]